MILNKKGFIGAIGDDLPSLIPIFLGLVVFFAVFLGVFNDYNAKNKVFTLNQEAIEITMQLKSDPVIVDYEHFISKCEKIKSTKTWSAFLIDLPLNTDNYNNITLQGSQGIIDNYQSSVLTSIVEGDEKYFICNEDNLSELKDSSRNPITYLYPIILQKDSGFSIPARLYVIIWE